MNDTNSIMVVSAHAHDGEVMGGATILRHAAAGWKSVMVHATLGEGGHPHLSSPEYAEIKKVEAAAAAKVLGCDLVCLPYANGELDVCRDVQLAMARAIRQYRPTTIVTHWKGSLHRDHINTHHNLIESLYLAGHKQFLQDLPPHRPRNVYFAENWEDKEGFIAQIYLDVTDVFPRYLEAMSSYSLFRGEVVSFSYEQWYRGASEMRGAEAHCARAVALMEMRTYYRDRRVLSLLDGKS
jgi:LmbE family N-acetylglucosaminyl deacetylase